MQSKEKVVVVPRRADGLAPEIRDALQRQVRQRLNGLSTDRVLEQVLSAAAPIVQNPSGLGTAARDLAYGLTAAGTPTSVVAMQELLQDVVALLDPTVQAAVRIFHGRIISVNQAERSELT
jgi:hypothetical protein